MKSILAFGDSNTWGLVPSSAPFARYSWEQRWTGVLQSYSNQIRILEEGLCGRTTIFDDALRPGRNGLSSLPVILESQSPVESVILMLGTNDCKQIYKASPYTIGKGIELCLQEIKKYVLPQNILLISPIYLGDDVWKPEKDPEFNRDSIAVSHELKEVYREIANNFGCEYLAASDYAGPDEADEEHMSVNGHQALGKAVFAKLQSMGVLEA